jgi:type VI secretion system protein ImpF
LARDQPAYETVRESVLDRLLDDEPDQTRDAPATRAEVLRRVVHAVRRDLEWLLGTRLTWVDDDLLEAELASRSVVAFGLQDFSHENVANSDAQQRLKLSIERSIATFEPRLVRVVVKPEATDLTQRALRFRIDAVLQVDPIREPVVFDTVMELSGQTEVREA